MPNWLFEILFFGFIGIAIAWPIFWRAVVFTAAGNVYEAITRKPETPPPSPEETAQRETESTIRTLEMMRQINESRVKAGLPPTALKPEFQTLLDAYCKLHSHQS